MEKASGVRDSWIMFCSFEKARLDRGIFRGGLVCFKGGVLLLASDFGVVLVFFLVDALPEVPMENRSRGQTRFLCLCS